MRYRKLGSVGLETSVVGVGASPLGPAFVFADRMTSRRAVAVARRSSPKGTSLKLRTVGRGLRRCQSCRMKLSFCIRATYGPYFVGLRFALSALQKVTTNESTHLRFCQYYGLRGAGALSRSAEQSRFFATAHSPSNMRGAEAYGSGLECDPGAMRRSIKRPPCRNLCTRILFKSRPPLVLTLSPPGCKPPRFAQLWIGVQGGFGF